MPASPGDLGDLGGRPDRSYLTVPSSTLIRKLRQREVAERAGIPATTLSLIEGERRRVTLDDALALCRGRGLGLGIGIGDLLAGADPAALHTLRLQ